MTEKLLSCRQIVGLGTVVIIFLLLGSVQAEARQRTAPSLIHVVALQVEFQADTTRFTTGNGTFAGKLFPGAIEPKIDPFPHDAPYFDAHLWFLENYIDRVSDSRTKVQSYLVPGVVRVSGAMARYSPMGLNSDSDAELAKLADLVHEAWTLAAESGVRLPAGVSAENTAFIIFHAGVGRDIELLGTTLDKTPQDLPSLYFSPATLARLGASNPVVDGVEITNTLIIPRTESRSGFNFITNEPFLIELSINGLLAASFLNYLGVPDLFNTATGESAIGPFGVMDALGIFAYAGLFPPEPSAWTKLFLGWSDVRVLDPDVSLDVVLRYTGDGSRNESIRLPISDSEYFLVENRHRDPEGDGVVLSVWNDGVISEVTFPNADPLFNDQTVSGFEGGVVIDVDQYDFALPGGKDENDNALLGGILVWHVDENRLRASIADNRVNADPRFRAIDLEEADGAQDIGFSSSASFFGPRFDLGTPFDFWYRSNPVSVRTGTGLEIRLYENRFASDTTPSSLANSGTPSRIEISEISETGPDMTFRLRREATSLWKEVEQSRLDVSDGFFTGAGVIAPFGDQSVFVFGSQPAAVYAESRELLTGLTFVRPAVGPFGAVFLDAERFLLMDPDAAVHVSDAFGGAIVREATSNMAWYRSGNTIHVRVGAMTDSGPVLAEAEFTSAAIPDVTMDPVSGPLRGIVQLSRGQDSALLIYDDHLIDESTGQRHSIGLPAPGTGLRLDAAVTPNGWFLTFSDRPGSRVHIVHSDGRRYEAPLDVRGECVPGAPVVFDITSDMRADVIVACGDHLFAFHANAVLIDGFPVRAIGEILSDPVPAADEKTGLHVVLVQTATGNLDGFEIGDRVVRAQGFPLPVGRPSAIPPFVHGNTMFTVSGDGTLSEWRSEDIGVLIGRNAHEFDLAADYRSSVDVVPDKDEGLLLAGEVYNWPNPVRNGMTHIRFQVAEVSDVRVTIIDAAGGLVAEFEQKSVPALIPVEIDWKTSVGSGLYFARIKAKSVSGRSDSRMIKMAVIR